MRSVLVVLSLAGLLIAATARASIEDEPATFVCAGLGVSSYLEDGLRPGLGAHAAAVAPVGARVVLGLMAFRDQYGYDTGSYRGTYATTALAASIGYRARWSARALYTVAGVGVARIHRRDYFMPPLGPEALLDDVSNTAAFAHAGLVLESRLDQTAHTIFGVDVRKMLAYPHHAVCSLLFGLAWRL